MTAAARGAGRAAAAGRSSTASGARLGGLIGPTAFGVTAATVALADAARALGASPSATTWPIAVYVAALALSGAISGRLLLVVGGRVVANGGAAMLAAGATAVLASPSLPALTISRGLLGAGAGAMAAIALTLAGAEPDEVRPTVVGGLSAVMATAIGVGPVLGGVLALGTWRAAFASPVASLPALAMLRGRVDALKPVPGAVLDRAGAAMLVAAAGGLILTVQVLVDGVPGAVAAILATTTVAATALLIRHAARGDVDGILPAAVVGRRELRRWWVVAAGTQAGQFSALLLLPTLLTGRFAWSTSVTGAVLAVHAIAGVTAARLVSRSADAPSATRALGAISLGLGAALVAVSTAGPHPALLFTVAPLAFGVFTTAQIVTVHRVCSEVPDHLVGPATGILSLAFLCGGATGAAATSVTAARWGAAGGALVAAIPPIIAGVAVLTTTRRSSPQTP